MAETFEQYINRRRREMSSGTGGTDRLTSQVQRRAGELMQGQRRVPLPSPVQPKQEQVSPEFQSFIDGLRNGSVDVRPVADIPVTDTQKKLPSNFSNINILADSPLMQEQPFQVPRELQQLNPLAGSDVTRAGQGDPAATQRVLDRASKITQADLNRARRADTPLEPVLSAIDWALYENPVGQAVSRFGYSAGEMIGGSIGPKPTTGNVIADTAADITGSIAGFAAPIAGMPNTSLMNTPYAMADNLLNTRIGGKAVQGVSNQLSKVMKPEAASRVATDIVRGGVAGAGQNVAQSLMRNESDADQLAVSAALGGGLGAAGDALLGAGGRAIAGLKRKGAKTELEQVVPEPKRAVKPTESVFPVTEDVLGGQIPDFMRGRGSEDISLPPRRLTLKEEIKEALDNASSLGITAGKKGSTPYEKAPLTSTMSQIRSRSQKEPLMENLGKKLNRQYQNWVDDAHFLNLFDKEVEKIIGRDLKATEKSHLMALNSKHASRLAYQNIVENLIDSKGNVVGKSLKDRLGNLPVNKYAELEDYLINKHAITRFERGEKVFDDRLEWTPESGQRIIKKYENSNPEFRRIAEDLYDFNRSIVNKWLVDSGLISSEAADIMFKNNPHYVPNKRYFSKLEKRNGGSSSKPKFGISNQGGVIKDYGKGGSQRQIISPIEAMIENVDAYVKSAKRNEAMQTFVNNLRQHPDELRDWAEIVQPAKEPKKFDPQRDNLDAYLSEIDEDFMSTLKSTKLDKDNIVKVMVNGEPIHVQVKDKDLLDALLSVTPEQSSWFMNLVGNMTRIFKTATTGVNPIFIVKNLSRDLMDAYVNSQTTNNPFAFVAQFIKSSKDIVTNTKSYQQYKNLGGGYVSEFASPNFAARAKDSIVPQTRLRKFANIPKSTWRGMENLLNATESMARLSEFKRVAKGNDYASLQQALNQAQESSINFSRRGRLGKDFDRVFPYFNAAIQGLDKFARNFKNNPVKTMSKAVLAVTIPQMISLALNMKNEDYWALPENVRDNNLIFPGSNGQFVKVAIPREVGTLFSALPTRMAAQFYAEQPDAWDKFAEQIISAFAVPGAEGYIKNLVDGDGVFSSGTGFLEDTVLSPVMEIATNKNFINAPIVPRSMEGLPNELQYDEKTSPLMIKLGELTGDSPMRLQHLTRAFTGGLGKMALDVGTTNANTPLGVFGSQFAVDPALSNKYSNQFYDFKDALDQANSEGKATGKFKAWYNDDVRKQMNRYSTAMSDIRKEIREVQKTEKNKKTRDASIKELRRQINAIAKEGVEYARAAGVKK